MHDGDGARSGNETRPQQAGEAETTRFGMESGDNSDVPATGGPVADEAEPVAPQSSNGQGGD